MTSTAIPLPWPDRPPELAGDVVTLRGWSASDADVVWRACQDEAIQRWTTVPVPYLPEHAVDFVTKFAPAQWESRSGAPFAVVAGSEVVGSCGLVAVDVADGVGEVGYWVAPWARGRGVAAAACRVLAAWALGAGGLARLELLVAPGNAASRAVAEAAGAVMEGVLRSRAPTRDGGRTDMVLYSLVG